MSTPEEPPGERRGGDLPPQYPPAWRADQPAPQYPPYPSSPSAGYQPPPGYYAPPGYPSVPRGYSYPGPSGPGYTPWGYRASRASMGARFGQLLIDTLVIGVPTGLLGYLLGLHLFEFTHTSCDSSGSCATTHFQTNSAFAVVQLLAGWLYWGLLVGLQGRTVGHRVFGLKVIDERTGGHLGFGRASLRWLVLFLTGAICTLGYWSPFFDPLRRGWHDKAADSIVVSAR